MFGICRSTISMPIVLCTVALSTSLMRSRTDLAGIHLAELGLEAIDGNGHHPLLVIRHVAVDELQPIRRQSIEDRHRGIDLLIVDGVGVGPLNRYLADIDGVAPDPLRDRQLKMQPRLDHLVELTP